MEGRNIEAMEHRPPTLAEMLAVSLAYLPPTPQAEVEIREIEAACGDLDAALSGLVDDLRQAQDLVQGEGKPRANFAGWGAACARAGERLAAVLPDWSPEVTAVAGGLEVLRMAGMRALGGAPVTFATPERWLDDARRLVRELLLFAIRAHVAAAKRKNAKAPELYASVAVSDELGGVRIVTSG
jgi:hypothetical protein